MAALNDLVRPADRSEYTSLADITFALHDWAVKEKFSFRRNHSTGLSWSCATKETSGCRWKVRGERQKRWRIKKEAVARDAEEEESEKEEEDGQDDEEEHARLFTLV